MPLGWNGFKLKIDCPKVVIKSAQRPGHSFYPFLNALQAVHRNIPIIEAYRHVTLILNYSDPQITAADRARLKHKYKK